MRFIVMEVQDNGDSVATIVNDYATKDKAESKYHAILSAAAESKVLYHSAIMIASEGANYMKNEGYSHPQEEVTVE